MNAFPSVACRSVFAAALSVVSLVTACSSSDPASSPSITGTGTVQGNAPPSAAGVGAIVPYPATSTPAEDAGATQPATAQLVGVTLFSNSTATCSTRTLFANTTALMLSVSIPAGAVTPGVHPIGLEHATVAVFGVTNADCAAAVSELATSGSITFRDVTSSRIAGSYDLAFKAEHVTGTFDVPVCTGSVVTDRMGDAGVACTR